MPIFRFRQGMKSCAVCYFDSNQSLEWDSLADVGYCKIKPTETFSVWKKSEQSDLIDNDNVKFKVNKDKNVNYKFSRKDFERQESWRQTLNALREKYGNHLKDNNKHKVHCNFKQIIPDQTQVNEMQKRSKEVTPISYEQKTKVNQENPVFQKIPYINDHTSIVKGNTFMTSYEENFQLNVELALNLLCWIFESKSLSRRKKKKLVDKVVKKLLHCNIPVHENRMKKDKPTDSTLTTSPSKQYNNNELSIRNESSYDDNHLNDGNTNFTSLNGPMCKRNKNRESEKPFQSIRKWLHSLTKSEINHRKINMGNKFEENFSPVSQSFPVNMKPCIVDFKKGGEFIPSVCQANNIKKAAKQSPNCSHNKLPNKECALAFVDTNWEPGSSGDYSIRSDYLPDEESIHAVFKFNSVSNQNIPIPSTCSENNKQLNSSMYYTKVGKLHRKSKATFFEIQEEKPFSKEQYIGTRSCRELVAKKLQSKSNDFCLYNSNDKQGSYVISKMDTQASIRNEDTFSLRQKPNSSKNYQRGYEISSMHCTNALGKTAAFIGTSSPDANSNVIFTSSLKASPFSTRKFPLKISVQPTKSKNFAPPVFETSKSEKKNFEKANSHHVNISKTCSNQQTQVMRQPVAYIIIFNTKSDWEISTLRGYLEKNRPDVVKQIDFRQSALRDLRTTRNMRNKKIREIFEMHSTEPISRKLKQLPPPIRAGGIFSGKEMKDLTSKRYGQLPEIIQRVEQIKRENEIRTNKLIAKIFSKRLQKLTHKGIMCIEHFVSIV